MTTSPVAEGERPIKVGEKVQERRTGAVVRVMAIAERYAMVRRPHATPFVVPLEFLSRRALTE